MKSYRLIFLHELNKMLGLELIKFVNMMTNIFDFNFEIVFFSKIGKIRNF